MSITNRATSIWPLKLLFTILPVCALYSCAPARVHLNQERLRNVLTQFHEDQIMENCIRSKEKFPIIQFQLGTVTGQVTAGLNGEGTQGETITNAVAGIVAVRPYSLKLTPTAADQLNVQMSPVTDRPKLYSLYEAFGEEHLMSGPSQPSQFHVKKHWRGKWYWVPLESKNAFFELAQNVSVANYDEFSSSIGASSPKMGMKRGDFERKLQVPDVVLPKASSATDAIKALRDEVIREGL